METELFYITYLDRASQSGKYPTDINLGALDNDDIAEKYILDFFTSSYQQSLNHGLRYNDGDLWIEVNPILITNDARLFLLYKGVFMPSDFRLYCRIYDNYETLKYYEKRKVDKGRGTRQAYEYFEKLCKGEGKYAYEYVAYQDWHDESGDRRSAEVDFGWKIIDKYRVNEDIKRSLGR